MFWPLMLSLIPAGQVVSFHVVSRLLNVTKKAVPQDSDLGILVALEKKIIKTREDHTRKKGKVLEMVHHRVFQTYLF